MSLRYQNPVWPGYFADPFVLRHGGDYFAYGTAETLERDAAGRAGAFKILRSRDLVSWQPAGFALEVPPERAGDAFWAPEVAEHAGRFHLFYSTAPAGEDAAHRLHVALADQPIGPFRERGMVLPESVGFNIDAHPFRDPRDGTWYLFFARDYFDGRAGTGLAVVPLNEDLGSARGEPITVLRANDDWQIYERNRQHYGRTWPAWHTVEGPSVVAHAGRYYCFYSGGNWQTHDYGIGCAVADHPLGPWRHGTPAGPVVLRQVPGAVLGPGHNCVTAAPDGTAVLVYHAWDVARTARRMCIDPLRWTPEGPRCAGPTRGPRQLR
ncbi:MAG: glycoside hydrolase [Opitutus sp.]|nr:glycoside hydrolase [Opitutus sp.]